MKVRAIDHRPRLNRAHSAPIGRRPGRQPAIAGRTSVEREPTICERCGAVYRRKTWRAGERARRTSPIGAGWTLCPACRQIPEGEYFGRILVTSPLSSAAEDEVRARIARIESRARHVQPERRLVRIDETPRGLEVLVTSQKLAHRIAGGLADSFGGRVRYRWADREQVLDASWDPPARMVRAGAGPTVEGRAVRTRSRS